MSDADLIRQVRTRPRIGDRLCDARGREIEVIAIWQPGTEREVIACLLRCPGKGIQEKFFSIRNWKQLSDWAEVVSVYRRNVEDQKGEWEWPTRQ